MKRTLFSQAFVPARLLLHRSCFLLLLAVSLPPSLALGQVSNASYDKIFSWAENQYPAVLHPSGGPSLSGAGYYYRYYSGTGSYLGFKDGRTYFLTNGLTSPLDLGDATGYLALASSAVDPTHLPLGDGKISTFPKQGYVWSCTTQFGGGGAFQDGPWVHGDGTYDLTAKIAVSGAVAWPSVFGEQQSGTSRVLSGNNLPGHTTGTFPIQPSDPAYQYDRNPNSIRTQSMSLTIPVNPTIAAQPSCLPMGAIGILNTGAKLFNALDALGRDAGAHEVQDSCQGHPEMSGSYHYHSLTTCLNEPPTSSSHSPLLGYAADGFGIFGQHGVDGVIAMNADLDECHGHTHEIEWNGGLVTMYHYHATLEYPYTLGCFRHATAGLLKRN